MQEPGRSYKVSGAMLSAQLACLAGVAAAVELDVALVGGAAVMLRGCNSIMPSSPCMVWPPTACQYLPMAVELDVAMVCEGWQGMA